MKEEEITRRADLARLVPPGGLMVELGVARGNFALEMIEANRAANYLGIDRYTDHHDDREFLLARGRIEVRGGSLFRRTFAEMLGSFADGEIDLVYVDGYAHTGQEGGKTLRDWWPKVKPGGIFAGHDYAPRWQPTMDAVDAFVRANGLRLNVIEEKPFPSWWVRKETKS